MTTTAPFDDPDDPLIGYSEIAELMGITPATVRNYRYKGWMPAEDFHKHGLRMWRRSAIIAWDRSRPGLGWRHQRRLDALAAAEATKEPQTA